jgi:hypothetical protein
MNGDTVDRCEFHVMSRFARGASMCGLRLLGLNDTFFQRLDLQG